MNKYILVIILMAVGTFVLALVLLKVGGMAIDNSFDNRDVMLCESAIKSKNADYLEKCECYYQGEDIRCIYKEEK